MREVLPERLYESLIVLRRVKFLRPKKLRLAVIPSSCKHVNVEECLILGWNVLEEREHVLFWVLISEGVEDEAFLRDVRVSVGL